MLTSVPPSVPPSVSSRQWAAARGLRLISLALALRCFHSQPMRLGLNPSLASAVTEVKAILARLRARAFSLTVALGFSLALAVMILFSALSGPRPARAIGASSRVMLAHLSLPGDGVPNRGGLAAVEETLRRRTNVNLATDPKPLGPEDPALFGRPLLWTTARGALPPLAPSAVTLLRRHLTRGGTWILDGPLERSAQDDFQRSARALALQLFPREKLAPLPADHTLWKSFYLLTQELMTRSAGPVLGLLRDRRAALIVVHGVVASGERGRDGLDDELQRRLAVNLVLYALCVDYKSDQVHAPAILERRKWRLAPSGTVPSP